MAIDTFLFAASTNGAQLNDMIIKEYCSTRVGLTIYGLTDDNVVVLYMTSTKIGMEE